MLDTRPLLIKTDFPAIRRGALEALQVNLGYKCNLSCSHCHVNAGPSRNEQMDRETVDVVLDFMHRRRLGTLDLTGGAPEMNPHFRYLVREARRADIEVIDRCNLTILNEPGFEDMAGFLAEQGVTVIASLPCYLEQNVDRQRGRGVYESSIEGLGKLNDLGYGRDPQRQLHLVYNPQGLDLPPAQGELEADYKKQLMVRHGIVFNRLLTITNMPIARFGGMLLAKGLYHEYMATLRNSFREQNLDTLMCRNLLSIDWQGYVYDCDFNQMLQLPLVLGGRPRTHLSRLLDRDLTDHPIAIGEHCFGCTAGQGSSCSGALDA